MTLSYVNQTLTIQPSGGDSRPSKPRKVYENDVYAGFVRRIIRAHGRRIADGDVEALRDLTAMASLLDQAISDAVKGLRAHGYSWAEIADRLGITRQAAQQRWGGTK